MSDPLDGFYANLDGYIARGLAPMRETLGRQAAEIEWLRAKLAEVESRPMPTVINGVDGKPGKDGTSVDAGEVAKMIRAEVSSAVGSLPIPKDGAPGRDGASVDPAAVAAMVDKAVASAVAAIPIPKDGAPGKDGTSVSEELVEGFIAARIDAAVKAIPVPKDGAPGKDGESVDLNDVAALIASRVDEAVAAIPRAKDGAPGKDGVPGKDAAPAKDGAPGKDGASAYEIAKAHGFAGSVIDWLSSLRGKDGDDGISFLSAVVDSEGELILTASDGTRHKAGVVRGKDGTNGVDGSPGAQGSPGRDAVAIRPLPLIEDGKTFPAGTWALHAGGSWYAEKQTEPLNGRNPKDAGWLPIAVGEQRCDIDLAQDGRTVLVTRTTSTGMTLTKRLRLPVMIQRGIFVAGKPYESFDVVTRSGSQYMARVDKPKGVPGASDDWQLIVKAGKDGK